MNTCNALSAVNGLSRLTKLRSQDEQRSRYSRLDSIIFESANHFRIESNLGASRVHKCTPAWVPLFRFLYTPLNQLTAKSINNG